ncbi:MAG: two pore domain potassium channel family protein, partial [Methanomicrobiales archaeon]|nr:two pore domain potassium channel family protein [Methanomicrobiales archaeon]
REWAARDPAVDAIRVDLRITTTWTDKDFARASRAVARYDSGPVFEEQDLEALRDCLAGHRDLLLRLLENPVLFEHEAFTDVLRAVFHLADELENRGDLSALPSSDTAHLAGDIKRAYLLLIREWLQYMRHLKDTYPYLFSLAARTNPFDPQASAVVA